MHTVVWDSENGRLWVEGRMQVQWHEFWGWMRFYNRRADREMLLAQALRWFALQHGHTL